MRTGLGKSAMHELAAAYALDALEPRELRRFERHLSGCPECEDEVRLLSQDAVRLGCAAAVLPPDRLRERVLMAVRTTAQEPPLVPARPAVSARSAVRARARGAGAGLGSRARPPRRFALRLTAGLAAASLVAAAALGVLLARTNAQLDQQRTAARAVNQVLAAADAKTVSAKGITAIVSPGLRRAVVTAHGLGDLPQGRVYQLWLMDPAAGKGQERTVRSVGLLSLDSSTGTSGPLVATALTDGSSVLAVTVEPDGGSAQPTTEPVTQLPLAGSGLGA
jgi:anti-sigma-K factor RskA